MDVSELLEGLEYGGGSEVLALSAVRSSSLERLASNAFSVTKEDDAGFMMDVDTGAGGGGGGGDALVVIGGNGNGGSSAGSSEGPEKSVGSAGSDRDCNTMDRPLLNVAAIVKFCVVLIWLVGMV